MKITAIREQSVSIRSSLRNAYVNFSEMTVSVVAMDFTPMADMRRATSFAGGYYYPGKGIAELQDEIRGYLDQGYEDVKIKIGAHIVREEKQHIRLFGSGLCECRHARQRCAKENSQQTMADT